MNEQLELTMSVVNTELTNIKNAGRYIHSSEDHIKRAILSSVDVTKHFVDKHCDLVGSLQQENETLSAANNDLKKEIRTLKNMLEKRGE